MNIRKFQGSDIHDIVSLFYGTVHTINTKDYTPDQLNAWAPLQEQQTREDLWLESLSRNITYVAEINGETAGFADMTEAGHIDRMFTHKDYQGQGIASALLHVLESEAALLGLDLLDVDASLTAKPFFEHHGFRTVTEQNVVRNGITLVNFKMIKALSSSGQNTLTNR
ncbi:GNAT family N-acetyltransferase [Paenibacillus sp. PK3_47]|uniref:GNAT family N-acetyltransferase n=1 Tax=Paenibacillus sp. PK3_47 TaxID=2072642 RepID=UPI00201E2FBF|nr:GNAT family N-acetyltransferase [Paenibacillus sp. PK3_47]UQZ37242.1 GNAT family N-acetyltransferase [Paenibacillus sp. PK3_47]